jgi:predicted permease
MELAGRHVWRAARRVLGYLVFAFLWPGLFVVSVYYEWTERPELVLVAAALFFVVVFLSFSIHAYVWFRWVKKREQIAFDMMPERGQEELEAESRSGAR